MTGDTEPGIPKTSDNIWINPDIARRVKEAALQEDGIEDDIRIFLDGVIAKKSKLQLQNELGVANYEDAVARVKHYIKFKGI